MKSLRAAINRHHELPPATRSARGLLRQFGPVPPNSLHALLIRTGPFVAVTDAFRFNNSFQMTEENGQQIRDRFQNALNAVTAITDRFKTPLDDIDLNLAPVGPKIAIPDVIKGEVLDKVAADLIGDLGAKIFGAIPGTFGRCGGMAFAGYDFFLSGFLVDERLGTSPPNTGVLGDYIFNRLLDSLELNVIRFLELVARLHVLPVLGKAATIALLASAGSFGGPIGTAIGAIVGTQVNFFPLGGPGDVLDVAKDEWPELKRTLDGQAAVPIGLIFGSEASPTAQHQVLAIGYNDRGDGTATLGIWDNNDSNKRSDLELDFRGSELQVSNFPDLKCFFVEKYSPLRPPESLKLPRPV
jgi:hypothetical protein